MKPIERSRIRANLTYAKTLKVFCIFSFFLLPKLLLLGQKTVFSDDFNTPASSSFTTVNGLISGTTWNIVRSGGDMGARVNGGRLEMTNNASAAANASGHLFAYKDATASIATPYNPILNQNKGIVEWNLNLQQDVADLTGFFGGAPYGSGFALVLASSTTTPSTAGNGYALVLGNSAGVDRLDIIRFNGGLQNVPNTSIIAQYGFCSGECQNTIGTEEAEIRVRYYPRDGFWSISTKLTSGTYVPGASGTDNTYTNLSLPYFGMYWQTAGGTAKNASSGKLEVILSPYEPMTASLSYNQSFGSTSFVAYPEAFEGWAGLNGATINNQLDAETTPASINCPIAAQSIPFSSAPAGGLYGYGASSNGKIGIGTSADALQGVNQPVVAIRGDNTISQYLVSYDMEVLYSGNKPTGNVLLYKGTIGNIPNPWAPVPGSVLNLDASPATGEKRNCTFMISVPGPDNFYYLFRWASWRHPSIGTTSSTLGLDNVRFTALASPSATTISSNPPATTNFNPGATDVVLQRIDLNQNAAATSAILNSLIFNTGGFYSASDLLNLKVRYSTDATLTGADPTLSTLSSGLGIGSHSMTPFTSQSLPAGTTGYLFITADISPTAPGGRYIQTEKISFDNIGISGATKLGISPLLTGNPQFIYTAPQLESPPTTLSVLTNSAQLSGNILSIGGTTVTKRGFYYSLTNGFADGTGTEVSTTGSYSTGNYNLNAVGLFHNTTYYFKSFAVNSVGTTYSSQGSFTTPKFEPTSAATGFACSATGLNTIPLSWTDATGSILPDGYLISWSPTSYAAISNPIDGVPVSDNSFNLNVPHGVQTATINNLTYNQVYYFKIFSYSNAGTYINYRFSTFGQTTCSTLSGQTETFESGTKGSYAAADVTCVLGSWNMNEALIGNTASDVKNGLQSVRMRNSGGYLTMNWDIPNGVSTVSVKHARYGVDAIGYWQLEYSVNGGSTWIPQGSTITTSLTTLATQTYAVNQPGSIRFRIAKVTNNSRINFDDILFVPYCSAPVPTSSLSFSNMNATGADAAWGSASGNGTMLVIRPSAATNTVPVLGTSYTPNLNWASAGQIDVNNRVLFRTVGSSVTGLTGLTPETQYTGTAYNFSGNCYQRDGAASASFWTLSNKPATHAAAFSVYASSDTKAYLNFSAASSITNADGYLLVQKPGAAPVSLPTNGTAYSSGAIFGDALVTDVITNTSSTSYVVSGLTPNTTYYFQLIPFNWDGTHTETYHYRTDVTIPMVNTTTSLVESVVSDVISDPTFSYASNINIAGYQGATANTTSGTVGVFKILLRDGGGTQDEDLYPTILEYLNIRHNLKNAIRAAGLFGGANQDVFISAASVGQYSVVFNGLSTYGSMVTAPDGETIELTLRVTFKTTFDDNTQLQFSVNGTADALAFPGGSSQIYDFPPEFSSLAGDRNRVEVIATKIAYEYQPDDQEVGLPLNTFAIKAVDNFGNIDLDESSCTVALSKVGGTGSMTAPGSPYTFSNGFILVSDVSFSAATATKIQATPQSCLGGVGVQSNTFNITSIAYATGDYRSTGTSWGTLSHWQQRNSFGFWVAPTVLPTSTNRVYINSNMSTAGVTATVADLIILSGASLTISTTAIMGSTNLTVKNGGNLLLSSNFALSSSGVFMVENQGTVIINYAATNQSTLWAGSEYFYENSNFIIRNWGVSASPSFSRYVYSGQISANRYINFFGKPGTSAVFGNLSVELTTNLGNTLYLTDGSSGKGLTNGNLTVKSTNSTQRIAFFGAATSGFSAVGGNLVVDPTYAASGTFQISGSGSNKLKVYGDISINAGNTVLKSNNGSSADTITVFGNLNVNSANLLFNEVASTNDYVLVQLEGDLSVNSAGNLGNFSNSVGVDHYQLHFSGTGDGSTAAKTQEISIASSSTTAENVNIRFEALSGSFVRLVNQNFQLGQKSTLKILSGATFDFGFSATTSLAVSKSGSPTATSFHAASGCVLKITSSSGINSLASSGNVHTDGRVFSAGAIYWYIGKSNQSTGDGLPNGLTAKTIICDLNSDNLVLSTLEPIQLPLRSGIQIRKGIFEESATGPVSGDGYLTFEQGTYRSRYVGSVFPNLTDFDRFNVSLGSFEMGASGDQILNHLPSNIVSLKVSGSGIKTLTESMEIKNSLEISAGILDLGAFHLTGNAGLIMTGGSLKMGYSGASLYPELTGIATNYSLTGGTIELYGSTASTTQTLRTTYGFLATPIVYNHLKISASESNFSTHNVGVNGPLQVGGNMEIFYPTVFYAGSSQIISGSGNFSLQPLGCLKFEEANGLSPALCGIGSTCGQIRTTSRSFSTQGKYWLTGNLSGMVTGQGLPSTVHTLMVNRTGGNPVTLTNDVTVTYFLGVQNNGMLETGTKLITLSDTANMIEEELAQIIGKLQTTRNLALTNHNFGGMGLEIDADGATPGATAVVRTTGTPSTSLGITRKFAISPTVNSGLNARLLFNYWESELNGLSEGLLKLYRSVDAGITWIEQPSTLDIDRNQVLRTGINAFSEWTLGDINIPLPLTLISFIGKADRNTALLNWHTRNERNVKGFILSKSVDGKTFDEWVSIPANNQPPSDAMYEFEDPSFLASSYYKIEVQEMNANISESRVIFLSLNPENDPGIRVFPNPSNGQFHFFLSEGIAGLPLMHLEISGMDGRLIFSGDVEPNLLEQTSNQVLGHLAPGMYSLRFFNDTWKQDSRIVKW